ncbi:MULTISPECIES: peptide deformylase [Alicyclobacillus]|uniref:Peptide deformylase n=1 Tax=Alicyclobacillus acidoterrestris (strain ATCC 49025 / DSM 3922 / CIP 106132 / NCIMB 13137 / GD3B) TaxID=1356854 RepID=T0BK04_ALIAG|nr:MULTISPECIES: peptide deformylase [Alicyclobacillus]EPZ41039.1 hypothetical protein N007_17590 [Alicyclobacillus acidoterrestris ATCC 49025]UNO47797.1 peptide deformylase [Alicyclobacillus acidoterrestris]GEO27199.1 hypothetical protein AAC03nite_29840 [Alicyclobacillus acidoterrestris]
MSIRPILQGDIQALRQVSDPVTAFDQKLKQVIDDLSDTVTAHRGLGLAAPQIDIPMRVIVVDVGAGVQVFVNPEIVAAKGEVDGYESCLSFPDHTLNIRRPQQITVRAQDADGREFSLEATDLLARVICHEVDHLNGILFMDYLSEEEMVLQALGLLLDDDDETAETEEASDDTDIETQAEEYARQQELQLIADTLAELSWKLTLSLEMLQDYRAQLAGDIDWNRLEGCNDALEQLIETLEENLSHTPR